MSGTAHKFTDEKVTKAFFEACDLGMPVKTCCEYAGISQRCYYNWVEMAEKDPDSPHGKFVTEVNRRRAAVQAKYAKIIMDGAENDEKAGWRAALEFLKATFPNEYNRKFSQTDLNVSGKVEHEHRLNPMERELRDLSREEQHHWLEHKNMEIMLCDTQGLVYSLVQYGILDRETLPSMAELRQRGQKALSFHRKIEPKEFVLSRADISNSDDIVEVEAEAV